MLYDRGHTRRIRFRAMLKGMPATRSNQLPPFDFAQSPFIVIWEATRACALSCVHCRADAIPQAESTGAHYR